MKLWFVTFTFQLQRDCKFCPKAPKKKRSALYSVHYHGIWPSQAAYIYEQRLFWGVKRRGKGYRWEQGGIYCAGASPFFSLELTGRCQVQHCAEILSVSCCNTNEQDESFLRRANSQVSPLSTRVRMRITSILVCLCVVPGCLVMQFGSSLLARDRGRKKH